MVINDSKCGREPDTERVGRNLLGFFEMSSGEPVDLIGDLDRARRHCVVSIRGRHLPMLTACRAPSLRFRPVWERAARWSDVNRASPCHQQLEYDDTPPLETVAEMDRLDRLPGCPFARQHQGGWSESRHDHPPLTGLSAAGRRGPDHVPAHRRRSAARHGPQWPPRLRSLPRGAQLGGVVLPCKVARFLLVLLRQHLGGGAGPLVFDIDEILERRWGANTRARAIYWKLRRKVLRVDGALTLHPRTEEVRPARSTSASSMQSPPASAAHQRQHLVSSVGPPRRAAEIEVMVNEFTQAQVLGEGGRQEQAGIGHQAVAVKDDADPVGAVAWQNLLGAPCFQVVFCYKTIVPDSEEHPFVSSLGL